MLDLLAKRRYLPLFLTQFGGAFNDNFFKNAMIIFVIYRLAVTNVESIAALAAGLFILPFFLFSAIAGQIADRFEKAKVIRVVKFIEIPAMVLATVGFALDDLNTLLAALFALGAQSAFFGPLKYTILPDHLPKPRLLDGNALIESSTFLAILLGTIAGGILISFHTGRVWVSAGVLSIACLGFLASCFIPKAETAQPGLHLNWNLIAATWQIVRDASRNHEVFKAILYISWFWVLGATFLTQIPVFARQVVKADMRTVTLFLTVFSVGVGVGSIACAKMLRGEISKKFVPLSLFGMGFAIVYLFGTVWFMPAHRGPLLGVAELLQHVYGWQMFFAMFAITFFGGLYVVPLYAILQTHSEPTRRSRTIAANNIMNALFMVVSAVGMMVLFALHWSVMCVFLLLGVISLVLGIVSLFRREQGW